MRSLDIFSPDWISPPGATIQRLMVKTGHNRSALANALDVSLEDLDKIISGGAIITKDMAHRLGSFFKKYHGFGTFHGVVIHWRLSEQWEAAE